LGGAARSRRRRGLLLALAAAWFGTAGAGVGGAEPPSWVEAWAAEAGATGSWFGLRQALVDRGITPTVTYVADLMGNPVGGQRRGVAYAGQLEAELTINLEKLAGLKGLTFNTSVNWASGTDLSKDDIGNFFIVSQAFAGEQVRLYTFYLEQSLFDGQLEIKLGRFAPGDDFLSWPDYTFLVNIALNPAIYATQVNVPGFTASPIGTWAGLVRVKPVESLYAMTGVYYSDPSRNLVNTAGTDFGFTGTSTGFLGMGEIGYRHNQAEGDTGLPGTLRVGAYYDSNVFPKLSDSKLRRRGNWGAYLLVDQVVYREGARGSGQGLVLGGSFVVAPDQSTNTIPYFAALGAVYRGLLPRRDKDALAFAAYYGVFSRDLPGQNSETVLELTYTLALTPWLTVQPDIQYVINPGGRSSVKNAVVIGAQISITF
jgi:porin